MKLFSVFLLICFSISIDAQRRSLQRPDTETETNQKPSRRGRTRFSAAELNQDISTENVPRRIVARRKPIISDQPAGLERRNPTEITKRNYEVEEVIDETPLETQKLSGKGRIITETSFQAQNVPNTLFQQANDPVLDTTDAPITKPDFSTETIKSEPVSSSELLKIENEPKKNQPEPTAVPNRRESIRRTNSRSRNTQAKPDETSTQPSRRTRTRPTKKPAETQTTVSSRRNGRRRPEPSGFVAEETQTRNSRSGQRVPRKKLESSEQITLDVTPKPFNSRRNTEPVKTPKPRNETRKSHEINRARSRFRSRDSPPVIDEQKLEVLPLFEAEAKTVRPLGKVVKLTKARNLNSAGESVETSATENDVKTLKPEISTSVSIETRTESSKKRKSAKKESVISEFSEVTSKRTIGRKRSKTERPKVENRSTKKKGLSSSEEEIDDSDNYPEPFKALIQAKKQNKGSSSIVGITKTTEKVVTSSSTTPASRQVEDSDNELVPSPSGQPTTKRYPEVTTKRPKFPTRKLIKSTIFPKSTTTTLKPTTTITKPSTTLTIVKSATTTNLDYTPIKAVRTFSPKPPRGLYSSRKGRDYHTKSTSKNPTATQVPLKKNSRYSARYRNDVSSRGSIRTSTNAPAYLPTIPTITPPTTSVKAGIALEDTDLGLEVITFDDPVNTIPSANLVNGDYVASSTFNPSLVSTDQTKTTEKSVSIIERIINSITAISTTEVPDHFSTTITTVQNEPTKVSAILKLATKKPTKLDKMTALDQKKSLTKSSISLTTEKPTTIIEKILSSLSAIQADSTTDSNNFKSNQVGSNFNTISSSSTTPMSVRVTKSLAAPISTTSVNPLSILDEISSEQTLQKRTIGKLLALLNTLTSTTSEPVVIVTPKTSTTTPLFTSPNPFKINFDISTTAKPESISNEILSTITETMPTQETTTPTINTVTLTESTTTISNDIKSTVTTQTQETTDSIALPLSLDSNFTTTSNEIQSTTAKPVFTGTTPTTSVVFSTNTESITENSVTTSSPVTNSGTTVLGTVTTENPTEINSIFNYVSTIPSLINFEVSPGSVSVFSANDHSNAITPADDSSSTVTISSQTSTTESSTIPIITTTQTESSTLLVTEPNNRTQDLSSNSTNTFSNRSNRLLNVVQEPVQNSIESASTPDYYIFAVLNNNTILRKRPSIPNKVTPYLVVGVYPNNTIVRKFPNGTLVPMEPVIRVDNTSVQNKANQLSIGSSTKTTTESSSPVRTTSLPTTLPTTKSSTTIPTTTRSSSSTSTTQTPSTLPTLTEILNGKTVQAFNNIINRTDLNAQIDFKAKTSALSNRILEDVSTTTKASTTISAPTKTTQPTFRTTTTFPSTTYFPTFFTSLLSTLQPKRKTTTPFTTTVPTTQTTTPTTSRTTTTTQKTTTTQRRTTAAPTTTRTTVPTTSRIKATAFTTKRSIFSTPSILDLPLSSISTKKPLTEQQKKDFETVAKLEKQQAEILNQLTFLTNLNFGNSEATSDKNNLANRIIALAVERDKDKSTSTTTTSSTTTKSITATQSTPTEPSVEELLKQLNIKGLTTLATPTVTPYGKTNEALIAALLKEQGIGPTAPKNIGDIFVLTTTTRKPRPIARPPGRLMQRLNWIFNALAPPATTRKPKPRPKEQELLTNLPTRITPVVTAPPPNSLNQEDIKKLISELEDLKKTSGNGEIDLSQVKSLQNLINSNDGVQVITASSSGTTLVGTTPRSRGRAIKSTTADPVSLSVSNSIEEDYEFTTTFRPRVSLPPVKLKPVPGIEDSEPLIRSNLVSAAVNVTRALSQFLGSALQASAERLSRLFSSSAGNMRNYFASSSLPQNISSFSSSYN